MTGYDLPTIIRTLLVDGFHLDTFRRSHGHAILNMHRYDRFGISIAYSIALFEEAADGTALAGFIPAAQYEKRHPLVVAPSAPDSVYFLSVERLLSVLGGAVDDSFVRRPQLAEVLDALGRHTTPPGFEGDPEEHLETAVAACLQYLIGQRARRWGIERRFERLPDGVLPGGFVLLYDAKSYSAPYGVSADDVRRFADYVNDFNERYAALIGEVFAFLVIAGEFSHNAEQRERRSAELYAECRAPLCHITSGALGSIVELVRGQQQLRSAVDWKRLLARHTLTEELVGAEMRRLQKDGLLPQD